MRTEALFSDVLSADTCGRRVTSQVCVSYTSSLYRYKTRQECRGEHLVCPVSLNKPGYSLRTQTFLLRIKQRRRL